MKSLQFALAIMTFAFGLAHAEVYRWTDPSGVTVYSDRAPAGAEKSTVNVPTKPKGSSTGSTAAVGGPAAAGDKGRMENTMKQLEQNRLEREEKKEKAKTAKEEKKRLQQNCEAAKSNLSKLESLGRHLWKTPEGQYRRLTEEERQQMMETARKQVEENCKD